MVPRALPEVADASAVSRVLAAEQEAERAVRAAEEEAKQLVAQARERGRRIAERADRRILLLRGRFDAATDRAIAELGREHADRARESERSLADPSLVESAVCRVADWLLGEDDEPKEPRS